MKNIITITVSAMDNSDTHRKMASFSFEETETTRNIFSRNGTRSIIWLMNVIIKHFSIKAAKGKLE